MHDHILIVVDDPCIRERYAEALGPAAPPDGGAYQVVAVCTLTNAVWYAARRRFDLVIIEAHIRGPRAAFSWLLVDRNPEVRVVSIDAPTDGALCDLRQRSGCSIVAPDCTAAELRAVVRSLL
jgi:DNA-binding NarL/FixJ family response regulator